MKRLIDDLRSPGCRLSMPAFVSPWREKEWVSAARQLQPLLIDPMLPVLLVDNVAEWYYTSEQEHWDLRDHFPNLAPPYPAWWAEHAMPRVIHSKEAGDTDMTAYTLHGRVGVLTHAIPVEQVKGENIPPGTKWVLWCELYIDYGTIPDPNKRRMIPEGTITGPHGSIFLCVDEHGVLVERPWMSSFAPESEADQMRHLITWVNPMLLSVCFLHCHNVRVEDNHVPAPLAKKFRARHGFSPASYKTLIIEPLKEVLRHEGRSGEVGAPKAMHICRGHFRDYREGRGLFGKYKKLVWTPAMVRGTKGKQQPREVKVKI